MTDILRSISEAIRQDTRARPSEHERARTEHVRVGRPEWSGQDHDHQNSYERSPANRGDG